MKEENRSFIRGFADVLRTAGGIPGNKHTAAIIVAGGSGSRFGTETPKQFQMLSGMPVVVHTLRAFEQAAYIDCIVCVVRKGDEPIYEEFRDKYDLKKLCRIVAGGASRQESVLCGVEALNCKELKRITHIAIHDAARPLITPSDIDNCIVEAIRSGAATAAHRAVDTIKIAAKHDYIESTPDRETVWHATTPQCFELNLYRAAAYSALESGFVTTDDNALVENIGRPVKLVDIGPYNIKITRPEDLCIAEALLKFRADKRNSEFAADSNKNAGRINPAPENTVED